MATLSARKLISNVAALFSDRWGAVTEQARKAGCSRQAIYQQEARVVRAVENAQRATLSYLELQQENRRLQEENQQLGEIGNGTDVAPNPFCQHAFLLGVVSPVPACGAH